MAGKHVAWAFVASFLIGVAYLPLRPIEAGAAQPLFREAARETGLVFQHFTGATGDYFLPEIIGAGVALFDYDGDGDLDVYLIQGGLLDKRKSMKDAIFPPPKDHWPGNRLFRNELIPSGRLRCQESWQRQTIRPLSSMNFRLDSNTGSPRSSPVRSSW